MPPSTQRRIVVVDREGAVQSEIRIGELVNVSRRDRDYAGVRLLSQLFGESFSGRLNKSLRIEKGLTYGSSGYFDVDRETAAFKMSTFTRTERTVDAIKAMLDEVERLQTGQVTQDELDAARDTLLGNFQMALETPAQIAARWWDLIVWGLPEGWYSDYLRSIASVKDPKVLDEVARSRLRPDDLAIVVAGDGTQLEKDLAAFGPVTTAPAE
jgi:predicted Zn-dependent peptidase